MLAQPEAINNKQNLEQPTAVVAISPSSAAATAVAAASVLPQCCCRTSAACIATVPMHVPHASSSASRFVQRAPPTSLGLEIADHLESNAYEWFHELHDLSLYSYFQLWLCHTTGSYTTYSVTLGLPGTWYPIGGVLHVYM